MSLIEKNQEAKTKKEKEVRAMLILEILGRPPEHLTETLNKLIEAMAKEKGTEVLGKKIHEPIEVKAPESEKSSQTQDHQLTALIKNNQTEQKKLYTTFAEIEVKVDNILYLASLMFKYAPATVEIIEPELIVLTNNQCGEIFSELVRKLHHYDEVARVLQFQNAQLQQKLKEILEKVKLKKTNREKSR